MASEDSEEDKPVALEESEEDRPVALDESEEESPVALEDSEDDNPVALEAGCPPQEARTNKDERRRITDEFLFNILIVPPYGIYR